MLRCQVKPESVQHALCFDRCEHLIKSGQHLRSVCPGRQQCPQPRALSGGNRGASTAALESPGWGRIALEEESHESICLRGWRVERVARRITEEELSNAAKRRSHPTPSQRHQPQPVRPPRELRAIPSPPPPSRRRACLLRRRYLTIQPLTPLLKESGARGSRS